VLSEERPQVADLLARLNCFAGESKNGSGSIDRERIVAPPRKLVDGRKVAKLHAKECTSGCYRRDVTELAARLVPRALPRFWVVALAIGLALLGGVVVRALAYESESLPGTRVAGVDVAGLDRAELVAAIQRVVLPRLARPVTVDVGGKTFIVKPRTLFALNATATADAALAAGRRSELGRLAALAGAQTTDVAPVFLPRRKAQRALVLQVRRTVGVRPRSANVAMDGTTPVITPAATGRDVVSGQLLASVREAALGGNEIVRGSLVTTQPRRAAAAAREAAAIARALVSAPVYVLFDERPLRALGVRELAALVRFEPRGERFLVTLDREAVARVLAPELGAHRRAPVDARFEIVGKRVRVVPSRAGVGLDVDAAVGELTAAAYAPERRVATVRLGPIPAQTSTAELTALGITRELSSFTTEMGVSSANRIWNVQLMADYIDGTVIKPGATFSFNRVVGPRTTERGFREGQMIVGSLLLPSIGGGVCQTATTLFNNAFELGLPIVERHNHSFYISHYPLGRDATVSWGGPDFVFKNDLQNGLLIKTSYTDSTLTFTFYGSSEGRRVVARTGPQVNWRAPVPSYAYDPYGVRGSIRTVAGSNQPGFDVTVSRAVYDRSGELLRRDAFVSKYVAVGPTTIYGPGKSPPRPYFVLPPPE
jgi:vancomycin resistance protein YoaR